MNEQFERFELLIGKEKIEELNNKRVAIFGIGGVGGHCVEALARSGVANFYLIDNDVVSLSNINRQRVANFNNLNEFKVDIMKKIILSINPDAHVEVYKEFYLKDNKNIDFNKIDYCVDCIDTVTAKINLVVKCKELNIPIISAMGCGNKLDPSKLEVTDLFKTTNDPLCKVMRHELRKLNIKELKVVYSIENPIKVFAKVENCGENPIKKNIPGSSPFVPSVAGIIIASEVVKDLIK